MPGTPSSISRRASFEVSAMPSSRTAFGSCAISANRAPSSAGNGAPVNCSERSMVPMLVTGISPARIGTSQPAAATRSRSRR